MKQPQGLVIHTAERCQCRRGATAIDTTLHQRQRDLAFAQQGEVLHRTLGRAYLQRDSFARQVLGIALGKRVIGTVHTSSGDHHVIRRGRFDELKGEYESRDHQKGRGAVDRELMS